MTPEAGEMLVHEILPRIAAAVPRSVKLVGCEDVEEVIQDTLAMAARMIDNVERSGKKNVSASNIAYYALQHIKSGRRSTGNSCVDVLATGTRLHGHCSVMSLDELMPVDGDDDTDAGVPLAEMISRDNEDPSTIAGRELDWDQFLESQDTCSRMIVMFIAEGKKPSDLVREQGISPWIVNQSRKRLQSELLEFFGPDALVETQRPPAWKANLVATRERHAARAGH